MTDWTRVKDKDTKHEYSVAVVIDEAHEVLDKPATNRFGDPLPPKHYRDLNSPTEVGKTVDEMTVTELHDYAAKNGIDLGEATKKADIEHLILASPDAEAIPAEPNTNGQEAN